MRRVMQLDLTDDDMLPWNAGPKAGSQVCSWLPFHCMGLRDKSSFIQAFTGSNRYILDYLIEEVFDRQSVDMREFFIGNCHPGSLIRTIMLRGDR